MADIDLIRRLLKKEEGFVPYAYKDSLGYWTIGYGKLIDKRGGGITADEAEVLLDNEILRKIEGLNAAIPWWLQLSDVRKTVLLSMAFQLGISGLMRFKRTLTFIQEGKWDEAASAMMQSVWAQQTPERAARMANAMRTNRLEL